MTATRRRVSLVRYVSPFGSPASMTKSEAERYLAQDESLWKLLEAIDLLDERMKRVGAPRIGDDVFHLSDLPEWETPDDPADPWPTIRALVRRAEEWTRRGFGERYVVVERAGRFAAVVRRVMIDGDLVRWEAGRP